MNVPLTPKQKEILEYIERYIDRHDYSPSFREIARAFGFSSVATVASYLAALKEKGYLANTKKSARSLRLSVKDEASDCAIPMLGIISAGKPIEAIQTQETIDIPRDMMQKNVFALKVRGDSMIEDGIYDGDYVIIQKTDTPKNGDIVVSMIDGENVTLKRFYKEKDRIKLQPANSKYRPIYTSSIEIQGKVLGVIRKYF